MPQRKPRYRPSLLPALEAITDRAQRFFNVPLSKLDAVITWPYIGLIASPLDSLLDTFSRCFDAESARRVMEFRVDPGIQSRIGVLAERATDGVLSEDERAEYESLVNAADLISILKRKASHQLNPDRS